MTNNQKTYVLYHASCLDGYGAALCAWQHLRDEAIYIPVQYGNPVPEMKEYSLVYILDFSYPKDVMIELMKAHEVVCLDHHKTAQEALLGLTGCWEWTGNRISSINFDMSKSGAMLAWEYFNPGEPAPRLIEILQDRDLWLWKREDTKAVTAALRAIGFSKFEKWQPGLADISSGTSWFWTKLITMGDAILKDQEQTITSQVRHSYIGNLPNPIPESPYPGLEMPMVNATTLISETCHAMLEDKRYHEYSIVCAWFFIGKEQKFCFSLRSRPGFDCSEIAKLYGGGGHLNASGMKWYSLT